MLKTYSSSGINFGSSLNKRYKYFKVSDKKKLSILSRKRGFPASLTLLMEEYPPSGTLVCFSKALKICQPHSRYFWSPVRRYNTNKLSKVSGRSRLWASRGCKRQENRSAWDERCEVLKKSTGAKNRQVLYSVVGTM